MKQIFLTTIIIQLFLININAQNTIGTQKDLVKKNYPKIDSLIDDFEKYRIKTELYCDESDFEKYNLRTNDFIDQLIIQLANTVPASIKPSIVQTNVTNIAYPKDFSDYISIRNNKIFKTPPPIYKGKFNKQEDSVRYAIYKGLHFLNLKNSIDSATSKFKQIDSIINVAEFIVADKIVKFTDFSVADIDKINKITLAIFILRDDYRYAKKLGYGKQLPEEGKKGFRELYKNKPNYIQYFDYIDKLNKSELDKHNKSE
jgi:hypothetical protein